MGRRLQLAAAALAAAAHSGDCASQPRIRTVPQPQVPHAAGVEVADFSENVLPPMRVGHRVLDLAHGGQFDAHLQDTPDEIRPPSIVAFYDSSDDACMAEYAELKFDALAETALPARERLMIGRYDIYAAPRRAWYKFTPELDLAKRFAVDACPQVVFVPRHCDGWTEWCSRGPDPTNQNVTLMGCEAFVDQCTGTRKWDRSEELHDWVMDQIAEAGEPKIARFLGSYVEQGNWLRRRDRTTISTYMRNMYQSKASPAFTERGFKVVEIPKEASEWLHGFLARHDNEWHVEEWGGDLTQMNFHEHPTSFVELDLEGEARDEMALKYLKPLIEEWSGIKDLELTAFYGIREYPNSAWLRGHIDRTDTHVLSATISLKKTDEEAAKQHPWPLEVVQWSGDTVRYDHPAGTMVMYESSKLIHGRPFRNEGGPHLGCFVHFKPASHAGEEWESFSRAARQYEQSWTKIGIYRETHSVEPEDPQYADMDIGKDSKWTHITSDDDDEYDELDEEELARTKGFLVEFKNRGDRDVDLYWRSSNGLVVKQGIVRKSSSIAITTFPGHTFFFAETGLKAPIPDSTFVMSVHQRFVKFMGTKDGNPKVPSKWAPLVRSRLKEEIREEEL